MANKAGHRRFGTVRRRASGRFQARYRGLDGVMRSAPRTFESKGAAVRWLTLTEGQMIRGDWTDPGTHAVSLIDYVELWIAERPLQPRTRDLYRSLLKNHIDGFLSGHTVASLSPAAVRAWRRELLERGRSEMTAAKSYRLLRAALNTAVAEDRLIRENPCRIRGFDKESSPERSVASVSQVFALAGAVPARHRGLVLFAAFTGLRWGELVALRRGDLDLDARVVRVVRKFAELQDGTRVAGPPKSAAGVRAVALPVAVVGEMRTHLTAFVSTGLDALLFVGERGASLRRNNWGKSVGWANAVRAAGLPVGFHFHDLRHTGNHLAAASGASTRELMHRMGHSSVRAALIYQHATSGRDREIADAMDRRIGGSARANGPLMAQVDERPHGSAGDSAPAGH